MIEEEAPAKAPQEDTNNELRKIYERLLLKKKATEARLANQNLGATNPTVTVEPKTERKRSRSRSRSRSRENGFDKLPVYRPEFVLKPYEMLNLPLNDLIKSQEALRLPVYKQHGHILQTILTNQVTLITGETGCGKSTQIPRILYQYLKASKIQKRILCVEPRRLAAMNLTQILGDQIKEYGRVSYQIGMENSLNPETRILYMTNGIFLQRLIHSCRELIEEYPFVVLDEIHERDIDTDFILLALMHILRNYPQLRVVLMSATLDNNLFKKYFAKDHIDRFLNKENFYVQRLEKVKPRRERKMSSSEDEQDRKVTRDLAEEFMKCREPCPEICITDKGCFAKKIYYLETLEEFSQVPINVRWGQIDQSQKSAIANKQLYEVAAAIIREILHQNKQNHNILLFLPGYAQIQQVIFNIKTMCSTAERERCDIIELHSTTLSKEIKDKLHETRLKKCKIIVATNIAESSITIFGVKYVIDFCLTKEIHYDSKSRLENLKLIWASQASCNQRAGRTGRVCEGHVFRLVSKEFFEKKLPRYSTPEIQRSSLDRLILRIKLLHESEKENLAEGERSLDIFRDPGKVLGKAIQPPALRNIDSAVTSLIENGGLNIQDGDLQLTELGRFYVDLPIDIVYAKMLILSVLFGVYDEVLKLVAILSQNRSPFRKDTQNNRALEYWELISTDQMCDFYSLAKLFHMKSDLTNRKPLDNINYYEVEQLAGELDRRVKRLRSKTGSLAFSQCVERFRDASDFELRFKLLICSNFIENLIRGSVRQVDEKREAIRRKVREMGVDPGRTVLLHSWLINCNAPIDRRKGICDTWAKHTKRAFRLEKEPRLFITNSFCCAEFGYLADIRKIMYVKYCVEGGRRSFVQPTLVETTIEKKMEQLNFPTVDPEVGSYVNVDTVLATLGEITPLHEAHTSDFYMRTPINIDSYTANRLVLCASSNDTTYLVTGSKTDKVSSMNCGYTCMLPGFKGACPIILLVFSHYASVLVDRKGLRYDSVKVKKRFEVKLDFCLMKEDMALINCLRQLLKKFYSLDLQEWSSDEMQDFWAKLKYLLTKDRLPMIEEDRWQRDFLEQRKLPLPSDRMETEQPTKEIKVQFMGPVYFPQLRSHYFSAEHTDKEVYLSRIQQYNQWKREVLAELQQLTTLVQDDQAYICCRTCLKPVCRANDTGPCEKDMYRTFTPLPNAVKEVTFDELGNSFCTGLMYAGINYDYKVCSCQNGHPLAIKLFPQNTYRFLSFSELSLSYPTGKVQWADFGNMDYYKVSTKLQNAIKQRDRLKKTTTCRICNETTQYLEHMKKHLKDISHIQSVEEFKMTLEHHTKQEQTRL